METQTTVNLLNGSEKEKSKFAKKKKKNGMLLTAKHQALIQKMSKQSF